MTAQETITKYLGSRKTGATVPEIVHATGVNENTTRRIVGAWEFPWRTPVGVGVKLHITRKCRVTGKILSAYGVQS